VGDVTFFDIGDCIQVDRAEERTITNIVGTTITVGLAFTVILNTSRIVEHCVYDNQVSDVQDEFSFICADDPPHFGDASDCYEISF